jgi:phytoene dehydrogenase-like protein
VLERADGPGGLARTIERGPYRFDLVSGIALGAELELRDRILEHLGAPCELIPLPDFYTVAFPGLTLRVPRELGAIVELHANVFPHEREGFARFFALCEEMLEATHRLPLQLAVGEVESAAERFPTFFRYRTATLRSVLDELFRDERAKALAAAVWPYAGLPPSRLSFFTFAAGWAVHRLGSAACRGGFSQLAEALAGGLDVAYGSTATDIDEGAVRLDDGTTVRAHRIVLAADPRPFLRDRTPATYLRRLERMHPSAGFTVLLLATTAEPSDAAHDNLVYESWDPEADPLWATVPTLLDPQLAPHGEHLVVARSIGDPDEETLLATLDARFGGGLTLVDSLRVDAAFGWEESVASAGSRRLAQRTPVRGLYLAGHWTQPGSGTYRAILSGMHAARAVLAARGEEHLIPEFRA